MVHLKSLNWLYEIHKEFFYTAFMSWKVYYISTLLKFNLIKVKKKYSKKKKNTSQL